LIKGEEIWGSWLFLDKARQVLLIIPQMASIIVRSAAVIFDQ